jgi:molybdopterin-guanine dinucleotide biosynthesis protein A
MTSCVVEGQVYPDQHVANMLLSFRLRSYSNSRVIPQCHEQFVTYITLIAKDCVYLLDNGERHFVDFVDVSDIRQTFYNVNTLPDLFTNITGDTILKFLKEINLYTNI